MSILSVFSILLSALLSSYAMSRDGIQVVGSSTVYPFSTVVAERYGRSSGNLTPTIESTGSAQELVLITQILLIRLGE
jgi:phosphate transport system substrate-binding protein